MEKKDEFELIKAGNLILKEQMQQLQLLEEQIQQLQLLKEQLCTAETLDLDDVIALELKKLSVPRSYKGYSVLTTIIYDVVEDRDNLFSLYTLYDKLSVEFGVTPHAIENNVYKVISLAKKSCSKEVLEDYFGKNVTIGVAEFIAAVADEAHRKYYKQKNKQKLFK